jgi:hypothetical protein
VGRQNGIPSIALLLAPAAGHSTRTNPKLAAVRRLQGQYLGALRGLPAAARAKVKALARAKGVAAAVKIAARMERAN